jgi:peptidyl-dipeptidase Dcp
VITLSAFAGRALPDLLERRDLREQAWRAWVGRGEQAGEHDNRPVARASCAAQRAGALHGHASYADFALTDTMAGTRSAVQQAARRGLAARAGGRRARARADAARA